MYWKTGNNPEMDYARSWNTSRLLMHMNRSLLFKGITVFIATKVGTVKQQRRIELCVIGQNADCFSAGESIYNSRYIS